MGEEESQARSVSDDKHEGHGHSTDHDEIHEELHREIDRLGKYSVNMKMIPDESMQTKTMKEFIEDLLMEISDTCQKAGMDLVGHIKTFVKTPRGRFAGSFTDIGGRTNVLVNHEDVGIESFDMNLHVIVHGIWDPEAKKCTNKAIQSVCKNHSIKFERLDEYMGEEAGA